MQILLIYAVAVPFSGWTIYDMKIDTLSYDGSIKLRFRDLKDDDVGNKIKITLMQTALMGLVEKWHFGGEFAKTSKFYNGRPVFQNSHGKFLYCTDLGGWAIGSVIGKSVLMSTSAGLSPTMSGSWKYWDTKESKFYYTRVRAVGIIN